MIDRSGIAILRPYDLRWSFTAPAAGRHLTVSSHHRGKRAADLAVCLLTLPVSVLLLLVCVVAVWVESAAPVIESERCAGRGGRAFRRYRLRTTRTTSRGIEPTRLGNLIRRTHLDGLPQLFNVLRGDMALVGPRPTCLDAEMRRLWHTARLDVKPGLVSAAQVWGRGAVDCDERVRHDVAYARNATLTADARIVVGAVTVLVLAGRYVVKRLLDVTLAAILLVVLAPVIAAVAVAVRRTSPGPTLFRQSRIGKDGRRFDILKFRTMRVDAEAALVADPVLHQSYVENDYKLPLATDPRITPLGRWLRRTSLDELPQLVNVLRGDMSLVGPRPIVPAELGHYRDRISTLLSVPPGLTGAWQVSGRSEIHYPERCEVELAYVTGWSLRQDVVILYRTVGATLSGRGAT